LTRFPHFAHLKLSDASEPSAVFEKAQLEERTSLHAKGLGWRASRLADGEGGEEIGYVPKRDDDAACVRFDRKLAASTEGALTVGGGILGQAVRLGLESIQSHVVTCVVVAVVTEFCVGCAGALLLWC